MFIDIPVCSIYMELHFLVYIFICESVGFGGFGDEYVFVYHQMVILAHDPKNSNHPFRI